MTDFTKVKSDLTEAARSILADMAFLDVIEPGSDTTIPNIGGPWASIEVNGSIRGLVVMMIPLDLKMTLIEAIYAQTWDDLHVDQKDDGLLEILNVLAGHYVSSQERKDGFLKLTIPAIVFDRDDLPAREPDVDLILDAQGALFRMLFFSMEAS